MKKEFEDSKAKIKIRKTRKDRKQNGQSEKGQ
jgi:hypothetical protein